MVAAEILVLAVLLIIVDMCGSTIFDYNEQEMNSLVKMVHLADQLVGFRIRVCDQKMVRLLSKHQTNVENLPIIFGGLLQAQSYFMLKRLVLPYGPKSFPITAFGIHFIPRIPFAVSE